MKARHVYAILAAASLAALALTSCSLSSVSIEQRISTFQSDLNTTDRIAVYQDFHPTLTHEYNNLKDPSTSGFDAEFPVPTVTNYSLSIYDKSNPTAGVIVQVTAGPASGSTFVPTYYLSLTMATTGSDDWRIVTLSDSQTNSGYAPRFN
jgi:hypothetical protein